MAINSMSPPGEDEVQEAGSEKTEGPFMRACDGCRARKIRCDRQSPDCTNCVKAGMSCGSSNKSKRVNHTKKL